jgi:hypothetical protein
MEGRHHTPKLAFSTTQLIDPTPFWRARNGASAATRILCAEHFSIRGFFKRSMCYRNAAIDFATEIAKSQTIEIARSI